MVLKWRHHLRHIPLAVLCCTMPFFFPHDWTFLCVYTLHPSACLCSLTYTSSPAFVIFSSLVIKVSWMMSIILFHIMCDISPDNPPIVEGIASCLYPNWLPISKELRLLWERAFKIWIISLDYSIISVFFKIWYEAWPFYFVVSICRV